MNPFHTLTDGQLAEWHRLTTRNDELERDLATSRKAVEAVQVYGEEERQKLRAELARRVARVAELEMHKIHVMSALRSMTSALAETLTTLRRLMTALRQYQQNGHGPGARSVLAEIESEADEVIRKYDIPFGYEPIEPHAG